MDDTNPSKAGLVALAGGVGTPIAPPPHAPRGGRGCKRHAGAAHPAHPGAARLARNRGVRAFAVCDSLDGRRERGRAHCHRECAWFAGQVQPPSPGPAAREVGVLLLPGARAARHFERRARHAFEAAPGRHDKEGRHRPRNNPELAVAELPALQRVRPGGEAAFEGAVAVVAVEPAAVPPSVLPRPHTRGAAGVQRSQGVSYPGAPQSTGRGEGIRGGASEVDHRGPAVVGRDPGEARLGAFVRHGRQGDETRTRSPGAVHGPGTGGEARGPGWVQARRGDAFRCVCGRQDQPARAASAPERDPRGVEARFTGVLVSGTTCTTASTTRRRSCVRRRSCRRRGRTSSSAAICTTSAAYARCSWSTAKPRRVLPRRTAKHRPRRGDSRWS